MINRVRSLVQKLGSLSKNPTMSLQSKNLIGLASTPESHNFWMNIFKRNLEKWIGHWPGLIRRYAHATPQTHRCHYLQGACQYITNRHWNVDLQEFGTNLCSCHSKQDIQQTISNCFFLHGTIWLVQKWIWGRIIWMAIGISRKKTWIQDLWLRLIEIEKESWWDQFYSTL